VRDWSEKTEVLQERFIRWLGIQRGKFFEWLQRYGKANEHNGKVPRDTWVLPEERQAVLNFHEQNPLEGYRRLAFMMLDQDVAAMAPSTVYRILRDAERLSRWPRSRSLKGTGFVQPERPHQHWHVDIAYINIGGTFYYLCALLDGYSRAIVHWEIRESMTERDVECIVQRALEKYPGAKPRIISDNGPQFIAKDFKSFVRIAGLTHVRISPYYPQSNGKLERWNRTVKTEGLRLTPPRDVTEARAIVDKFVAHYNAKRLHSAIGYIAPYDKLEGREQAIWDARDKKLEDARDLRRQRRQLARDSSESPTPAPG
jgi:transposase InsO family protein